MKCTFILVLVGILWISCSSLVSGSYDEGYGVSHSSYPAPPVTHGHGHGHVGQGWGNSQHNAGSYYHYHVPLVGQQQQSHYHPQPHQSNDHHLYYLIPLLLLALLPLLLLPLLPLLLIPLGLSLLALLLPLLMMGGMMMMMMMDGGMMMMMMRNAGVPTRHGYNNNNNNGDSRGFGFGHLVLDDLSNLVSKYTRSLDLDFCPERFLCETGSFMFPENGTEYLTARTLMNFLVEQATPKGQSRRLMRNYKEAFWTGSKSGNCTVYKCQPAFKIYAQNPQQYQQYQQYQRHSHLHNGTYSNLNSNSSVPWNYADYYYKNLYGDQISQQQQNISPLNSNYNNYYYSNNNSGPGNFTNSETTSKHSGIKGKYKKHHHYHTKTNSQVESQSRQPSTIPSPNVQVSYSDNENELRSAKV